jgi:signal transduction histidine kinase
VVDIEDDGDAAPEGSGGNGTGHGVIGMRERAELFGGTLHAGPRPEGGYAVHAELPLAANETR